MQTGGASTNPLSPCAPWCSVPAPDPDPDESGDESADVAAAAWCCTADLSDPDIYTKAVWSADVASSLLFRMSGWRFNGVCRAEDYLCVRRGSCGCLMLGLGLEWRSFPIPSGDGATWLNERCLCRDRCDCRGRSRIALPYGPVSAMQSVTLNGEVLDPTTYTLMDGRYLYFRDLDHRALAACFDPFTDPVSGLKVAWDHGTAPPPEGVMAACSFACELLKACLGQPCQLPKRVSQVARQGVTYTVLDPMEFLKDGKTGIYDVDLFLSVWSTPSTTATWVEDVVPARFRDDARPRW